VWAPRAQVARALRGEGVQLVDLDRLEEAETVLKKSSELEPDSEVAKKELDYIKTLKSRRQELPWFVRVWKNPPTDPVTIRLLTLTEGLPSIPGPKTVGDEHYSRIFDAFMERGWEGFEEEFDRIVPRSRADYEDVKRELLCEPIFRLKVHRRLAEGALRDKNRRRDLGGDRAGPRAGEAALSRYESSRANLKSNASRGHRGRWLRGALCR
jgi:hypothetical protein